MFRPGLDPEHNLSLPSRSAVSTEDNESVARRGSGSQRPLLEGGEGAPLVDGHGSSNSDSPRAINHPLELNQRPPELTLPGEIPPATTNTTPSPGDVDNQLQSKRNLLGTPPMNGIRLDQKRNSKSKSKSISKHMSKSPLTKIQVASALMDGTSADDLPPLTSIKKKPLTQANGDATTISRRISIPTSPKGHVTHGGMVTPPGNKADNTFLNGFRNSVAGAQGAQVNTNMDNAAGGAGPYKFGYDMHGQKLAFIPAVKQHIQRYWILNPKSNSRQYWNLCIFFIIMYYIIEIPLRLGFHFDNCNSCSTTILHLLCDCFFMIDCLAVQIRTSYFIEDSNQTLLELNPKKILFRYLKGWFVLDFLTSVPIHHVLVYYYDVNTNVTVSGFVQFAYLARMLKVIRFIDLLSYYHSVEGSAGTFFSDLIKILKFIFGFFVIAHMSACMWMFIALQERRDSSLPASEALWDVRTWPGNLGYTAMPNITDIMTQYTNWTGPSYVVQSVIYDARTAEHNAQSATTLTPDLSYLMALYWAVSTMTTVGYGDIIPRNDVEIAYACLVIFIGAVTFGYIISNVSSIIQIEDDADTKIRDKITSINAYMAYRKLPPELQKKIRNHYEYTWKRKTVYDEKEILQNLPTYLRTRVALYLNQDLIRNVAFLRDLGSDCLALLVTELRPFRVGAGYWIFKQGSLGREMCFVHEGMVEVLGKKNKQLAILQRGSYFGEFAILADRPTKRSASVRALTGTDLFALTKDSFDSVLKIYPELKEEVQAHAEARLKEAMEGKQERDYNKLTPATPAAGPGARPRRPSLFGSISFGGSFSVPRTPAGGPMMGGSGGNAGNMGQTLGSGGLGSPGHRPAFPSRLISVPAPFGSPNLAALGIRQGSLPANKTTMPSTPFRGGMGGQSGSFQPQASTPPTPMMRAATTPMQRGISQLGFNPYLSLPNSRPEESEDEHQIRRKVLQGKQQLESIMHPELAEEIARESEEAQALLDAQIQAEKEFMEANTGLFQRNMSIQARQDEIHATNPYIDLNARIHAEDEAAERHIGVPRASSIGIQELLNRNTSFHSGMNISSYQPQPSPQQLIAPSAFNQPLQLSSRANVMHMAPAASANDPNGAGFSLENESVVTGRVHQSMSDQLQLSAFLDQFQSTVTQTLQPLQSAQQQLAELQLNIVQHQQSLEDIIQESQL